MRAYVPSISNYKEFEFYVWINEEYPTIYTTRKILNDGAKYFGPYPNVSSAKEMVSFIKEKFQIRQCKNFRNQDRACLNYHIKRCLAPCVGYVTSEEYRKQIDEIIDFLDGKEINSIKMYPDLMIYLKTNKDLILKRLQSRKDFTFNPDFFDYETEIYEQLCKNNDKMVIVDNNKSKQETVEQIEKELANHKILLKRR